MDDQGASAGSLSKPLERISIAPPPHEIPHSTPSEATPAALAQEPLRRLPSMQSLNNHSPNASRRSSVTSSAKNPPSSPPSSRKSYGVLEKQDPQIIPQKPAYHRKSSMNQSPKPLGSFSIPEQEPPAVVTAGSVAAGYFARELSVHSSVPTSPTETIVIIHDACYGHRFSRPKTSKATLSVIVERPERIQAGVSGIAAAYVRLGQRHAGGLNPPHPNKELPSRRPFSIKKSTRLIPLSSAAVTAVHGTKWMQDLTTMCDTAGQKLASGGRELTRPETPGGNAAEPKLHEGDLYLCKDTLEAFQGALGGVLDGVDAVFECPKSSAGEMSTVASSKRAFVCVRPPGHHCSADMPSGFCWLNNVHVGIEHAAQAHGLTHAAIIDFDLHHGDGSQNITWERNDKAARAPKNTPLSKKTSIGYFSLHDINSYPCEYGDQEKVQNASLCIENSHNQNVWNVHLQPWKTEADFWELYRTRYLILLDKARAYLRAQTQRLHTALPSVQPKSAIFISAGFDASEWEGQGMQRHKVNVPTEFYAIFTEDIIKLAEEEGTSANGRVISVLEGGYSDRALMSGVLSHMCGLAGVKDIPAVSEGKMEEEGKGMAGSSTTEGYDKSWWSVANLSDYEALLDPKTSPISRKIRTQELSTFATPTQSFTAKVVDPSKVYRSLSGAAPVPEIARSITPPPPDVDWATAAHELRKLLVPTDRTVNSCRHEELSEPRGKRERHSVIGLPISSVNDKMQLRGRKTRIPDSSATAAAASVKMPIREVSTSRRRTIDSLPAVMDDQNITEPERPSTSDSKAQSDTSTAMLSSSGRASRATSPSKRVGNDSKAHRTRRVSGAKADLMPKDPNVKPPPVPRLPTKLNSDQGATIAVKGGRDSTPGDVDSITTGIRRIILKPSKATEQTETGKAAPKPVVSRAAPKSAAPKSTTGRATKATKAPPAPVAAQVQSKKAPLSAGPTGPPGNETVVVPQAKNSEYVEPAPLNPRPAFAVPAQSIPDNTNGPRAIGVRSDDLLQTAQETRSTGPSTSASNNESPVNSRMGNTLTPALPNAPLASLQTSQLGGTIVDDSASTSDEPASVAGKKSSKQVASTGFIPYNPAIDYASANGAQTTHSSTNPESLTWLPPNTSTPTITPVKPVKLTKQALPVFSANGVIPFGKAPEDGLALRAADDGQQAEDVQNGQTELKEQKSVWDVPETPQR